ncbi:MAG TPA: ABC transporter substrate-binding protein [Anaerolineae bacterium]|nr:ABC transporter substrate-binding protein [Anaerolineae bacterium]
MSLVYRLRSIMLLLFLTSILIACSGGTDTDSNEPDQAATQAPPTAEPEPTNTPVVYKPEGTLTVAITTIPNSLDLVNTSERNAYNASIQLYDTLIWIDDAGTKVPALAESWEISPDGLEYTFNLRRDVTFHNGEPFNAAAMLFSWERNKQEQHVYSDQWNRASNVEVIDEYTIKATTPERDPFFLNIVAERWIATPPQYFAEVGDEGFATNPVGTGPFMFESWEGDTLTFKANPNYWEEETPKVETLIFKSIIETEDRLAAIQAGEIDIATRLNPESAAALIGNDSVQTIRYPVNRVYYIAFNNLTTGLDQPTIDPLVRQAMNYAIDRQTILNEYFDGYGRLATGLITPGDMGYDYGIEPYEYDPEKAKELLDSAGYPDGFSMDFACPADAYANFEKVCESIKADLEAVGITTNLELMESGAYWDLEAQKELPPLFGDSWSVATNEAYNRLVGALGGWEQSYSAWSEETIDDYLHQISTTVDDGDRAALYAELQLYMYDNPPFIYLYEPVTFEAITTRVQNYEPRAAENYYLDQVSVEDDE